MGTCSRCVKFGLKIPNRLGKMSENLRGYFFDSHCIVDIRGTSYSSSQDSVYGAVIVAVHSCHCENCHCESSPGSSDECSTQRQVAADLWTKQISMSQ